jgi:hypothetical protein
MYPISLTKNLDESRVNKSPLRFLNRFSTRPFVFVRLALIAFFLLVCPRTEAAQVVSCDICVFGGTSGGVAAAASAARLGQRVALTEFGNHLGGMTSGGLSQTDIGNKAAIGGISREFYRRMGAHYGTNEVWKLEPGVAEALFRQMLDEAKVPVFFGERLASVKTAGGRIQEIAMENGDVFRAKMFIDASYEGDLMAKAGVSYFVGRESNAAYHETLDGIRAQTPKHQFIVPVDPYVRAGDAASGLLPGIESSPGTPGDGDKTVQAYNFRLCLTQNPTNKIEILPPENYDPRQYELLARYLEALQAAGKKTRLGDLMHIQPMPNGKTDINNNGGFSTDFIGANYDYPDASYARRAQIWKAHEDYTRGFLHFLATSPRVPASIRAEMRSWGLCKDEFQDTGGWPFQLYIREARRMISDYVMTENNCRYSLALPDSIGLAAYTMDSHNCRRIVRDGRVENEGDVQVGGFPPYQISYRAIVPKAAECKNLFVPVCLSSTHIAYGSIRMEPVFMVLGQSAAAAACLALERNVDAQNVPYAELRQRLLEEKQVLEWDRDKK